MKAFALIITSDSVFKGVVNDEITPIVEKALEEGGHQLVHRVVVSNDVYAIRGAVADAASRADVVLVTGGTGLSPRDVSIEAVKSISSKELPGFGEVFRLKSLEQVGLNAMLSRASAFLVGSSLVFVTPGSPQAVKLALELILPVVDHALAQARGEPHRH
ncbi:MAG: molybdenum cofactor biosynthesis protein B [Acidilobus sp.]|jgi:molybdenum cofactor synthesis domain